MYLLNKVDNKLSNVDISAKKFLYKFVIEQTFTQFDWKFMKQFIFNNERNTPAILKSLSQDQLKRLLFNVFPDNNNTLLHYLAYSSKAFEVVDYFNKQ